MKTFIDKMQNRVFLPGTLKRIYWASLCIAWFDCLLYLLCIANWAVYSTLNRNPHFSRPLGYFILLSNVSVIFAAITSIFAFYWYSGRSVRFRVLVGLMGTLPIVLLPIFRIVLQANVGERYLTKLMTHS